MSFLKRFTLVVFVLALPFSLWAVDNDNLAERVFVKMPDSEILYLNMSLKSEMVEFYKHKSSTKVSNLLGGKSWISYMDSSRIDAVLVADKCFLTMRVFERKCGKSVYAIVKTLLTPIADSNIRFYNEDFEIIESDKLFELPKFSDFFVKTKDKKLREVMDKITMVFLKIEISASGNVLVSLDDMWLDVLDKEISNTLLEMKYNAPLCYKWTGKRFKRVVN